MIFATVGTQLPFPRLIDALDGIAPELGEEIVAQIGPGQEGKTWKHLDVRRHLTPSEYEILFTSARVVVAHAGIGTILSARKWGKPLIILPRRHALDEHRNDHQLATANELKGLAGIHVAWEVEDLIPLLNAPVLEAMNGVPSPSHAALIIRLRQFIDT